MAYFGRSFAHTNAKALLPGNSIPLDLGNSLEPFKGRGRFTLRIERLPEGGRLSAGKNNGDRTWSVARDELDDLSYIPPSAADQTRTLSVRIIGMDGGEASTLALFDVPLGAKPNGVNLEPATTVRSAAISVGNRPRSVPSAAKQQTVRIAEELVTAQAAVPIHLEVELQIALELEAARAVWKSETDRLLAAAFADLEHNRKTWHAEQETRAAAIEKRNCDQLALVRQRAECKFENALADAETLWRQDEAVRLATVKAEFHAVERKLRAEIQGEREQTEKRHKAECHSLRETLGVAQLALARQKQMAADEMQVVLEQTNDQWHQKLGVAQVTLKAGEAQRIEVAEIALRKEFEQSLMTAPSHAAINAKAPQQAIELRETAASLEQMLEAHQIEIDQLVADHRRERADIDREFRAALARREAQELERLKVAEIQWQSRMVKAQEALATQCESLQTALVAEQAIGEKKRSDEDAYTISLARQLKTAQAAVVDREAALAHAHASLDELSRRRAREDGAPKSVSPQRGVLLTAQSEAEEYSHHLWRDVPLVIIVTLAVVLLYSGPGFPFSGTPQSFMAGIRNFAEPTHDALPSQPAKAEPVAKAGLPRLPILRPANLHIRPSMTAQTIASMEPGQQIAVLDRKGNWVHVRLLTRHASTSEGWVYYTFLGESEVAQEKTSWDDVSPTNGTRK